MRRILSVIGTRPQILKLDPRLADVVINTGQHYDDIMSGQYFREQRFIPKYNLKLTSDQVGQMIDKIRVILRKERPDIVAVYGDTYSTAAGTMAAVWEGIQVAHIEAGLRSGDITMPEEVNRIMADRFSTYKFCPTHTAMENLRNEGIADNSFMVGDTLLQTMRSFLPLKKRKDFGKYIFSSVHRRENLTPENLWQIISGLGGAPLPVLLSMHPHTARILKKCQIKIPKNISVVRPLPRKETLDRIFNSAFVVTDSGGLQREAYWILRHSYIIRTVTEWREIVESGWGTLVPPNAKRLIEEMAIRRSHPNAPVMLNYKPNDEIRRILK